MFEILNAVLNGHAMLTLGWRRRWWGDVSDLRRLWNSLLFGSKQRILQVAKVEGRDWGLLSVLLLAIRLFGDRSGGLRVVRLDERRAHFVKRLVVWFTNHGLLRRHGANGLHRFRRLRSTVDAAGHVALPPELNLRTSSSLRRRAFFGETMKSICTSRSSSVVSGGHRLSRAGHGDTDTWRHLIFFYPFIPR